jgi:alpha-galactosidase
MPRRSSLQVTALISALFFLLAAGYLGAQEELAREISSHFTEAEKTASLECTLEAWQTKQPPFYFEYAGQESPGFIAGWQQSEGPVTPSPGGETHHYLYRDPATNLEIAADVRVMPDHHAIDWVLHFTNKGAADTPILEDIQPLHWAMKIKDDKYPLEHWATGSLGGYQDFGPQENECGPTNVFTIQPNAGRSSNGTMPFFNLQNDDQGIIGAIGWTGGWQCTFCRPHTVQTVDLGAGMQHTHLLLHPGETIRTPRIVLQNWKGGTWQDAQNAWRRLMLFAYSPREPDGGVVRPPLCDGTWGCELIDTKLKHLQQVAAIKMPYDVYWVDAGWYGDETPKPPATIDTNSPWYAQRGDWVPNAATYPHGLGPLGDAAKAAGLGFLLWIESETADANSARLKAHPDWFLTLGGNRPSLVDLGNPASRQALTDLVSSLIDQAHMTWYRQDFNVDPAEYWAAHDTPDRVGMTEINYITGLYQFWDDLRARHPGLQIDNCASGGRRLDVETCSRSIPLWRSDLCCSPIDPIGNQMLTQGLAPWVPLNNGSYGGLPPGVAETPATYTYSMRSAYSSGANIGGDPLAKLKPYLDEYRAVQPYFAGDFYPLLSYTPIQDIHTLDTDAWTAWQFDRPDLKSGLILALRRQDSPILTIQPQLHAIDAQARYDVEFRAVAGQGKTERMSGADLQHLAITIPETAGSMIIIYRQTPAKDIHWQPSLTAAP